MENKNIKVFLRIKPTRIKDEKIKTGENSIEVQNKCFTFDRIFNNSNQQEVYTHIANDFIIECMQGYNCIVFAYGQTGSGKTHTIQGNDTDQGLVPRTLGFLHNSGASLRISFLEIYNEQLFDLLNLENTISLREDPFKGVYAENLTEVEPETYEQSMSVYKKAIGIRRTGSTEMNNESSRSHSVFTIHVVHKTNALRKQSRIIFVDLAGSERLNILDSTRKTETSNINKSLLCLGEVIKKLGRCEDHISYRDSRLTFLLRDYLAGNSKLAMIGTVNLSSNYTTETMSTLKFMSRVKLIQNSPVLNSELQGSVEDLKQKINELDAENQKLRMECYLKEEKAFRKKSPNIRNNLAYKMALDRTKKKLAGLTRAFEDLRSAISDTNLKAFRDRENILLEISKKQDLILQLERKNIKNMCLDEIKENMT